MLKLLMVTAELPYPPTSGGRIKSWNMLNFLAGHFELGLVCPLKYGTGLLTEFKDKTSLAEFHYTEVDKPRNAMNVVKSYLNGMPLNVYRTCSETLKSRVADIAGNYDILLLDHYESFQYVPKNFQGNVVLHTHNATYLMWERYSQSDANWVFRAVTGLEAFRVKAYERNACIQADQVYASPNDIENLSALGASKEKFRTTFTPGDDTQLDLPSIKFDQTEKSLFYVGTLNWEANVDGLLWFFDEVWPALKRQTPELRFDIAGGNIDPRVTKAAENLQDVNLLGFVDDLEPLFQRSRIFVSPLRFGSGIKVKVLNSMCRGLPVVTTSVGAEGLGTTHMTHLAITDEANEMVEKINQLLEDKQAWEHLEKNSRELIRDNYTWKRVLGHMVDEMTTLANQVETDLADGASA